MYFINLIGGNGPKPAFLQLGFIYLFDRLIAAYWDYNSIRRQSFFQKCRCHPIFYPIVTHLDHHHELIVTLGIGPFQIGGDCYNLSSFNSMAIGRAPNKQTMAHPKTGSNESGVRKLLSVVTPCFNESEVINLFYNEIKPVLQSLSNLDFEIIFIDNGSRDDTLEKLNNIAESDSAVRVCSLSRNFGHQIALSAGLEFATGDVVVLMDADLQHPPGAIPEFVKKWHEGFDIVSGVRTNTQSSSWLKNVSSNSFYSIFNFLSTTPIPQGVGDFCLLTKRVSDALKSMPERHRFLRGMISWTGYNRTLVTYECAERAAGQSKYSPRKMVGLAMDAVFSFSAQPVRLALRLGLTLTVLGFIYLIWTVVPGLFRGNLVPGYASLIGVSITLGGCQLAFIGLIGEYLARVFEEVKGRPIYCGFADLPGCVLHKVWCLRLGSPFWHSCMEV